MQLGRFTLAKGASLAPMAGATDTTMRRLCAAHGAVCTVSEMVSAKALTMGDKKSPRLMAGGGGDIFLIPSVLRKSFPFVMPKPGVPALCWALNPFFWIWRIIG